MILNSKSIYAVEVGSDTWTLKQRSLSHSPRTTVPILPRGVAVDSKGIVYVADTGNNRIQKFDSNGKLLVKWGESGNYKGGLRFPSDPAVLVKGSDVYIYVADSGNNRIGKYIQLELRK